MSTTIIDNLFKSGDTIPSTPWFRAVGGVNETNGKALPLSLDSLGSVHITPTAGLGDAFERLRTSLPYGLIDTKQILDNNPLTMESSLTGSGTATFSANIAATNMTLTTANGDSVIRQSRQYIPYQPGRSHLIMMSAVMGTLKTNVRQRVGYFDVNNGLFFEQDGTNLKVVRRTFTSGSPVDNAVNQSSWNLDKLDGTGTSGVTLDTSKVQLFIIDFSWLGAGGARLGVLLVDVGGTSRIVYCHQFAAANTLTSVYMTTPTLPMRWEITNTGVAASGTTMVQICGAVFSEGGFDPRGVIVSQGMGTSRSIANGTTVPVISVRLKSTFNRGTIIPLSFDVMSTSAQSYLAQVVIGGTLTGASFSNTSGAASEFDVSASAVTGGVVVASAYTSQNGTRVAGDIIQSALVAAANIAGTTDIISVTLNALTGTTVTYASLTWKEIY